MKLFVPLCYNVPSGIFLVLGIGLTTLIGSAYAEGGGASSKEHHVHHHRKASSHTHHSKVAVKKKAVSHKHHSVSYRKSAVAVKNSAEEQSRQPSEQVASGSSIAPLDDKGSETGLPLPRFAALRADRVYMRRGPGERYPIDWVYHRRGYPVKIEREFGVWRLVEDPGGQKGWVHQVTLRGGRSFVIPSLSSLEEDGMSLPTAQHADPRIVAYMPEQDVLRSQNHDISLMSSQGTNRKVVAVLKPGTVGTIKACFEGSLWCHVTVRGYDGWLERQSLWGVKPGEIIQPD